MTTGDQTVIDDRQHRLEMLLWQAQINEKNVKRHEATKVRKWVADFLILQSEVVGSKLRRVRSDLELVRGSI